MSSAGHGPNPAHLQCSSKGGRLADGFLIGSMWKKTRNAGVLPRKMGFTSEKSDLTRGKNTSDMD